MNTACVVAAPTEGCQDVLDAPGDQQHGRQQRRRQQRADRRAAPRCGRREASCGQAPSRSSWRGPRAAARTRAASGPSAACAAALCSACQSRACRSWAPALGLPDREDDDPEQRNRQPEGGQQQVLPARLERVPAAAESDEQRRGCRRRLDDQPRDREVAGDRHRQQRGPEQEQRRVVEAARPRRRGQPAPAVRRKAGESRALHRPMTEMTASSTPLAPSIRYHRPRSARLAAARERDRGERQARCRGRERRRRPPAGPPGGASARAARGPCRASGSAGTHSASVGTRLVTQPPAAARCRRCPCRVWIAWANAAATVTTSARSNSGAELDHVGEPSGNRDGEQREAVLGHQQPDQLEQDRAPRDDDRDPDEDQRDRRVFGVRVADTQRRDEDHRAQGHRAGRTSRSDGARRRR